MASKFLGFGNKMNTGKTKKFLFIFLIILILIIIFLIFKYMGQEKTSKKDLPIRMPVVAGSFYPADPDVLSKQIDSFLEQAEDVQIKGELKMMILPHAGYQYSGGVAAYGFKKLINQDFKTVVLIGPSHADWFNGSAVYPQGYWQTPLGKIEIEAELAEKLINEDESIFVRDQAYTQEHCLEVMLPFLQKVLKDFKIVPIIISQSSDEDIRILAQALEKYIDEKTLVIISSDLSHYPSYKVANQVDQKTIQAILTGQLQEFDQVIEESMSHDFPNLDTCACGGEPIKVALVLAQSLGLDQIKLLKYANSGDISGDFSRVVGYATITFSQEKKDLDYQDLSEKDKQTLLQIARQSIEEYLESKKVPEFKNISSRLKQAQGAFVTLRKDHQLRGCIGRIIEEKQPLYLVVSQMAIAAAVEDTRFSPVELEEMKEINVEVSVLSPLKKIKDPFKEIEMGKHGVIVQKGLKSGVFLPQVATENNWDLETFMGQLCYQKAGLDKDAWKTGEVDIYVYTAEVFEEKE